MISYEYYKVFYYCCQFMNFTKAAEALDTSQSSISHTINTLEYQLGCRLFVRSNRGIDFTAEGERLYYYVREGCEQFMKGENELINGFSADSGTVYLSATETALHCFLFGVLNSFRETFPGIKFIIENSSSFEALNSVKSGKSDYAVLSSPIDIPDDFSKKSVLKFRDILIGGEKFRELAGKTLSFRSLIEYPFITLCSGTATRSFLDGLFKDEGIPIRPDIEVATTDMMLPMVRNNMGLGFIPEPLVTAADGVYMIKTDKKMPMRDISIIYRNNIVKSPAAKTFYSFCLSERV